MIDLLGKEVCASYHLRAKSVRARERPSDCYYIPRGDFVDRILPSTDVRHGCILLPAR